MLCICWGLRVISALDSALTSRSPEKVDTIMDDIRDQMAISTEISDAIARPALGTDIDEDELREELEQLEQEELDNKLVGVDVPSQRVPTAPERRTIPQSPIPLSPLKSFGFLLFVVCSR